VRRRPALSPEATADLEEIRQYTAERFGEDQARRYLLGLREALQQLVSLPNSGREVAVGSEIRSWLHRGHYRILYRGRGGDLEIGRIIHAAREAEYQRALEVYLARLRKSPHD
jgi:toxin ParE1/3/4